MTHPTVTIRTGSNQRDTRTVPVQFRVGVYGTTCTVTATVHGYKVLTHRLQAVLPSEVERAKAQLAQTVQRFADDVHAKARAARKFRVEAESSTIAGGNTTFGQWAFDADWQAREKFAELIRIGFTRRLVLEIVNGYGEHVGELARFDRDGVR